MIEDVLEKVTSAVKLVQLDLTNSSLHNGTSAVDIGFVANKLLFSRFKAQKKKISDKDFYSVKAPIRCGLVRNLAWLHPLD